MISTIKQSWSAFDSKIAKAYLDGYGHPSERSKVLMASVLAELFGEREFRLADFGCGNGHLYSFFRNRGLNIRYIGYDFSTSLLDAARERHANDARADFVEADIQNSNLLAAAADIVLFSHVLEMLESPGAALAAARKLASCIIVRFFEPPADRFDLVELRQMEVGVNQPTVPYLRRSFSQNFYDLLLAEAGCRTVGIHQVLGDKDQVHILSF